jgi:hypothetical protein
MVAGQQGGGSGGGGPGPSEGDTSRGFGADVRTLPPNATREQLLGLFRGFGAIDAYCAGGGVGVVEFPSAAQLQRAVRSPPEIEGPGGEWQALTVLPRSSSGTAPPAPAAAAAPKVSITFHGAPASASAVVSGGAVARVLHAAGGGGGGWVPPSPRSRTDIMGVSSSHHQPTAIIMGGGAQPQLQPQLASRVAGTGAGTGPDVARAEVSGWAPGCMGSVEQLSTLFRGFGVTR